jgi:hypothetical protein
VDEDRDAACDGVPPLLASKDCLRRTKVIRISLEIGVSDCPLFMYHKTIPQQ